MRLVLPATQQKIRNQLTGLYSKLLTTPCLLCGKHHHDRYLCIDCESSLPKIHSPCPRCALPSQENSLCGQCLKQAPYRDQTTCVYIYRDHLARLITGFKFHNQLFLSRFFAQQLAKQRLLTQQKLPQLLLPIPLHTRRLRQRGYNQANELVKELSQLLSIPFDNQSLTRTKDTSPQTSLSFSQRKKNLKQAFAVKNNGLPHHIALIDDVLTTGHTAETAIKVLKSTGVKTVELWTIARTIRHDSFQG